MKYLLMTLALLAGPASLAAAPCENYAKGAAIRAYKAEAGTIQGSEGISYEARLVRSAGDIHEFAVTIADNNEDGEAWETGYLVKMKDAAPKCQTLSVKKTGVRDL